MSLYRPALLALAALAIAAAAPSSDPRIGQLERDVVPAVLLKGAPVPHRSLKEAMVKAHVSGLSIAFIHDGRIAWTRAYGIACDGGAAVTARTRFQAGSISKSIATLGAMRLVDAKRVALDADVNRYLKTWKVPTSDIAAGSPVTLRGLLSHTAGVNGRAYPGYARGGPVPTLLQILDGVPPANTAPVRVTLKPGAQWSYSGGGYTIVQAMIGDVTGQRYSAWMQSAVLTPLAMRDSGYEEPVASHACGHGNDGAQVPGGYHLYPEQAAAGLWTTPSDLARALIATQRSIAGAKGAFLSRAAATTMLETVRPGHSIGFDVGGAPSARWFRKAGDTEGFASLMVAYGKGDGVVVMTNGSGGSALAEDVVRSLARLYGWPDFQPRVREAIALPESVLTTYPGRFIYDERARFDIVRKGNMLEVASPGETPETLYAASATEFFTLSQDVSFVFDGPDSGHLRLGSNVIPFRRDK
ncbi:MAG: serine hydrolase domain-containing protein [Sphingomonas sp.]|uniref:serine hydrolase domain-containing protein n=1 Tax=Sphingomonas sp. TaxID=28214 RepID=UPI003F81D119